jgi:hypothetical protein
MGQIPKVKGEDVKVKGEDVIVYLDAEENPRPVTIKSKMALSRLKEDYGEDATV